VSRLVRSGPGSLAELDAVLNELGVERALLVTTRRGATAVAGRELPFVRVFAGVRPHVPVETVEAACEAAREVGADGLVGLGGGAAIDSCKAVVSRLGESGTASDPPKVVAVPTTYAGAEWTPFFGMLLAPGRKGGGRDERATPVAAIYDPELTLELPLAESVGTAMNALAHCVEALYHPATNETAWRHALAGATGLRESLPRLPAAPGALEVRAPLLESAMHAALALAESGLCLAHAMAQGLGGRFDLPQGTMNALCLPVALRFNASAVPDAMEALRRALDHPDPPVRCEELAALGGFPPRLRDHGVPENALGEVSEAIAARAGARANPREVTAADLESLLRSLW
jgi:maleylacetate reductase